MSALDLTACPSLLADAAPLTKTPEPAAAAPLLKHDTPR